MLQGEKLFNPSSDVTLECLMQFTMQILCLTYRIAGDDGLYIISSRDSPTQWKYAIFIRFYANGIFFLMKTDFLMHKNVSDPDLMQLQFLFIFPFTIYILDLSRNWWE